MPGGNETGPTGQGPGTGRGIGRSGGRGRGRMGGNRAGAGIDGECVCPVCGAIVAHQRGISCNTIVCLKCHARMTRK